MGLISISSEYRLLNIKTILIFDTLPHGGFPSLVIFFPHVFDFSLSKKVCVEPLGLLSLILKHRNPKIGLTEKEKVVEEKNENKADVFRAGFVPQSSVPAVLGSQS